MINPATAALVALSLASGGAFTFYGYETLYASPPRGEYERYGLPQMRVFVGRAQLLGAVGVFIGLISAPVGLAATFGLCVMMLLGLQLRYRLRDGPRLMLPAATLAIINGSLVAMHAGSML